MYDQAEFEALVRQHQDLVFRTLLRLTGSREHLEDLAQEAFLRLYRGLQQFRGEAAISTYLYRILINVAQDEWKRRRAERQQTESLSDPDKGWEDRLASSSPSAEWLLAQKQTRRQVEAGLRSLSAAERTVLVLYHQEERSYDQIAAILNLPIGTVRTHLHRGRQRLKKLLQQGRETCARTN